MSLTTGDIVQYEDANNVLEEFRYRLVTYLAANCLNCTGSSKAIDKRFIPGTELQRLRVGVVRGTNNPNRELVLKVANDNEYSFITKKYTKEYIENDLYNYMRANVSNIRAGQRVKIMKEFSDPSYYEPQQYGDAEQYTTLKGRIVGTEEFIGGAYSAMLTFISNRVVRVCGWGLSDLSPIYPSSKKKKAYTTPKEFIDAVSTKTKTYVQYFYNDQITNQVSPQRMTIRDGKFFTNDFIFDYINNNTHLLVLKQVLEFEG